MVILTDSIANNGNTMVNITWWAENLPRMWNASQVELNNTQNAYCDTSWLTWFICCLMTILKQTTLTADRVAIKRQYSDIKKTEKPSVLWRCWLGGRKGILSVKTEWWGNGVVICLEQGANNPADATATPPSHSSKIQNVYLSGASLTRLSWKRPLNGCR